MYDSFRTKSTIANYLRTQLRIFPRVVLRHFFFFSYSVSSFTAICALARPLPRAPSHRRLPRRLRPQLTDAPRIEHPSAPSAPGVGCSLHFACKRMYQTKGVTSGQMVTSLGVEAQAS